MVEDCSAELPSEPSQGGAWIGVSRFFIGSDTVKNVYKNGYDRMKAMEAGRMMNNRGEDITLSTIPFSCRWSKRGSCKC